MNFKTTLTILVCFCSCYIGSSQNPLSLSLLEEASPETGTDYELKVEVSDFNDLYSFQLFFLWDSTVLRIKEVKDFNSDLESFDMGSITLPENDNQNPRKGKVRIAYGTTFPMSLANDSHLMTLIFDVIGAECDTTVLSLGEIGSNQNEIIEVVDQEFNNIGAISNDPLVQIPGPDCLSSVEALTQNLHHRLYPNPVKENLTFELEVANLSNYSFYLLNSLGQVQLKQELQTSKSEFNLKSFASGNYIYQIKKDELILAEGKLVKI